MSTFCIVLVLFAAQRAEGINSDIQHKAAVSPDSTTSVDQQTSLTPIRKGKKLEAAVHVALRRWAKTDKSNAPSAAREFISVFNELKQDTSLARSTRLELGRQIRSRLIHLAEVIRKSNAANGISSAPPNLGDIQDRPNILGQMGGGMNQPGGMGNPGTRGSGRGFGGIPPNGFQQDAGEELVDLIQKTISPASWDINGGPGSIQYWRPGHALVVRASEKVHEEIGGLLGQLH